MSLNVQFVYDTPHREIASMLCGLYQTCSSASIVAGFMTVEGIEALIEEITSSPSKLQGLVVGNGTWRAFDAFDRLLDVGVPPDRLRVHLGHTRLTGGQAKHRFYRYHPMLHSKVYLFEMPNGTASAFVGSHNITGFALGGLNGEAGVLLEGPALSQPFSDIRDHIAAATANSVQYDSSQREAFAWWASQYMDGFAAKFNDLPKEGEGQKTIVIVAQVNGPQLPSSGDVIYFEFPNAIKKVTSLSSEVHLYLFDSLPASPTQALSMLDKARASYWCKIIGVEDDQGGKELQAAWQIAGARPMLQPVKRPFRPTPGPQMQQLRVQAYGKVFERFDYLFGAGKPSYEPILDSEHEVTLPPEFSDRTQKLGIVPQEHLPWARVTGLRRTEEYEGKADSQSAALRRLSPEEGSFIMMSMRRRSRPKETPLSEA